MDIIEKNIGFEALYESANKCKANVLWKASVASYILHQAERTIKLETELKSGTYKAKPPKSFKVTYPKPREILSISFRDRVYQRSLNDNSIYPCMVKPFIYDNLACQKGKGTDLARKRLKYYLKKTYVRERKEVYALCYDIHGYYDNIPHAKVEAMFRKYLDKWVAERGIEVLANQYSGDKGYNPGSQMVQIVGISYLNPLDHFIKERLHCRAYLRYMDDFILLSTNKAKLEEWKIEIDKFLDSVRLEPNPKKTKIVNAKDGIKFLGFYFRLTKTGEVVMIINPKNVKHERKKLAKMVALAMKGERTKEKVDECYQSWRDHASKGNSFMLLQRMDNYYKDLWSSEMELTPREKALLQYAMANTEKNTKLSEQAEAVIDYNVMVGNLADPEVEEN